MAKQPVVFYLVVILNGLLIAPVLGSYNATDEWKTLGVFTVSGFIGSICVVMLLLGCLGFTSNGVAAGSIAAFFQVPFTVAGGLFSILQSLGAGGSSNIKLAIGLVGACAAYCVYMRCYTPSG